MPNGNPTRLVLTLLAAFVALFCAFKAGECVAISSRAQPERIDQTFSVTDGNTHTYRLGRWTIVATARTTEACLPILEVRFED